MTSIDLKKLESLSCLKIDESQEHKMLAGIQGVVEMLHAIDQVNVNSFSDNQTNPTQLATDVVDDTYLFDKNKTSQSVNIQDGLFLAPKVISK